jgi:hypothetical protein
LALLVHKTAVNLATCRCALLTIAEATMSDIGKIRLIHDLGQEFNLSASHFELLKSQLASGDKDIVSRFAHGFEVEDWFHALYSLMTWSMLIHGLNQNQLPPWSKAKYQVPDFLALIEATSLEHLPLLIEVKRVQKPKQKLEIPEKQFAIAQKYSERLGMPLVYAVYWDSFSAWSINTPDTFGKKSSKRKLLLVQAFEMDCSLLFGDIPFLITEQITRTTVYRKGARSDSGIYDRDFGQLVSDVVTFRGQEFDLNTMETSIFNAGPEFATTRTVEADGMTTVSSATSEISLNRFSVWITRLLSLYDQKVTDDFALACGHEIQELMKRLDMPQPFTFSYDRTPQVTDLQERFLGRKRGESPVKPR